MYCFGLLLPLDPSQVVLPPARVQQPRRVQPVVQPPLVGLEHRELPPLAAPVRPALSLLDPAGAPTAMQRVKRARL